MFVHEMAPQVTWLAGLEVALQTGEQLAQTRHFLLKHFEMGDLIFF
jgi:hypothetical protein